MFSCWETSMFSIHVWVWFLFFKSLKQKEVGDLARRSWNKRFFHWTFDRFGFPLEFIKWIKILYKLATSKEKINGIFSPIFPLFSEREKQECPLSPLFFNTCVESLGWLGMLHHSIEHKLVLFADDIFLFISKLYNTILLLMQKIDAFNKKSSIDQVGTDAYRWKFG